MEAFSSRVQFQRAFRRGLEALLDGPELNPGHLVLVLANAIALGDQALLDQVRAKYKTGGAGEDAGVLAFALAAADPLQLVSHRRTAAGWQLQLNRLRARRPRRDAAAAATTVRRPFDPAGFNFTRVPAEAYWHGAAGGQDFACYYNKYPFEAYHTLVVPDPDGGHEQFLRPKDHAFAWDFTATTAQLEPGVVLGYNCLGAFASVNHLHFQMITGSDHLPLLQTADLTAYPVPVHAYTDPDAAWGHIDRLQAANQPFNALYTPGRLLLIERRFQGAYEQPAWTTGFAWYELSGNLITIDPTAYETLTDAQIAAAFHQVTA